MSIESRLLDLKKEIESAKIKKAQAEGALNQNLNRLKEEFKCRSIEQAQKQLEKLKEQKEILQGKIESAMKKLEEDFEW
jgi:chromosome segregation ATPase